MMSRRAAAVLGVLGAMLVSAEAKAEVLYAATGGSGLTSTLYVLDPVTGKTVRRIGEEKGVGFVLTAMRRHPITGVMYGISSASTGPTLGDGGPASSNYLLTIDLKTGVGTPVAPLRFADEDGGPSDEQSTTPDITFTT